MILVGDVAFGADDAVLAFLAERIAGFEPTPGAVALGVLKQGRLVAGAAYERFNGVHVEASIAAEPGSRWASRRTLFALFDYPFGQLGCRAVTVTVPATNLRSLNLALKLGFAPCAYVPFAARDGSTLVVLQMERSQCRWIGHGQGIVGAEAA